MFQIVIRQISYRPADKWYTMTYVGIAKQLTAEGIKTPGGKDKWCTSTVKSILKNEKYRGDGLLQKSFTIDYLTKKKKINEGEIPQYYVEGDHEAIIPPETFDLVQREIAKRGQNHDHRSGVRLFSSKIRCGECGSFYGSKVWHSTDKYKKIVWRCNHKYDGGTKCPTPALSDDEIKAAFLSAANKLLKTKGEVISKEERCSVFSSKREPLRKNGTALLRKRKSSPTPSSRTSPKTHASRLIRLTTRSATMTLPTDTKRSGHGLIN